MGYFLSFSCLVQNVSSVIAVSWILRDVHVVSSLPLQVSSLLPFSVQLLHAFPALILIFPWVILLRSLILRHL